jgi:hypothetical protein
MHDFSREIERVLRFCYEGRFCVDRDNLMKALYVCEYLQIPTLRPFLLHQLEEMLSDSTAVLFLGEAIYLSMNDHAEMLSAYCASHWSEVWKSDWAAVPPKIVHSILRRDELFAADVDPEYAFHMVFSYLETCGDRISREDKRMLLACVRFEDLAYRLIEQAEHSPFMEQDIIYAAFKRRVRKLDSHSSTSSSSASFLPHSNGNANANANASGNASFNVVQDMQMQLQQHDHSAAPLVHVGPASPIGALASPSPRSDSSLHLMHQSSFLDTTDDAALCAAGEELFRVDESIPLTQKSLVDGCPAMRRGLLYALGTYVEADRSALSVAYSSPYSSTSSSSPYTYSSPSVYSSGPMHMRKLVKRPDGLWRNAQIAGHVTLEASALREGHPAVLTDGRVDAWCRVSMGRDEHIMPAVERVFLQLRFRAICVLPTGFAVVVPSNEAALVAQSMQWLVSSDGEMFYPVSTTAMVMKQNGDVVTVGSNNGGPSSPLVARHPRFAHAGVLASEEDACCVVLFTVTEPVDINAETRAFRIVRAQMQHGSPSVRLAEIDVYGRAFLSVM